MLDAVRQILRSVQDTNRDDGWRIKWIPWQAPGRPECVYNTPLTTAAQIAGIALFLGGLGFMFMKQSASPWILVAPALGWVLIILARIYAAWHKQRGWICIPARCVDRELRNFPNIYDPTPLRNWQFRLLCEFTIDGKIVRATPEPSHLAAFRSEDEAQKYLVGYINPDGDCRLWVNSRNPLQASFPERKKM